jgi:hypothetical protein
VALDDPSLIQPSWTIPPEHTVSGAFPVDVRFDAPPERERLWAIPVFGYVAKLVILIPHTICLTFLLWFVGLALIGAEAQFLGQLLVTFAAGNFFSAQVGGFAVSEAVAEFVGIGLTAGGIQLILWLWVLFGGKYPTWGYAVVGGTLRWLTRVSAFGYGLTDLYPPFSFKGVPDRPVDTFVQFDVPPRHSRWWAIPVLGLWAKELVLVPHWIVLAVIAAVAGIVGNLIVPFFVLFSGRYPGWALPIVGGAIRYFARVYAFLFGLTDSYPPFRLS